MLTKRRIRSDFANVASQNLAPWPGNQQITPAQNLPIAEQGAGRGQFVNALIMEPHRIARMTRGRFLATTVPQIFLPASTAVRNILILRNTDLADVIAIGFGSGPDTVDYVISLMPQQVWGFDVVVPQDDLWALSLTNTAVVAWEVSTIAYSVG